VVRQAVRQTYTYYTPEDPEGRVVSDAPLAGKGKAWTLGRYVHPAYPSPLNVRVGDAGIHVSTVIGWLRSCSDDIAATQQRYGQVLQEEDIEVARWFYDRFKEHFDQELARDQ